MYATSQRGEHRANKKATGSPLNLKSQVAGTKGAVMPPQTITTPPASITLQMVDASGNPVPVGPGDTVTGTLTSDAPSFVISPAADTLHYTATIQANTPLGTVVNLAATANGTVQGAQANLVASVQLTLNIPPSPVAVDLNIILG